MSDLVPLGWFQHVERRSDAAVDNVTLRLASSLVQDGVTRVTVVIPRAPGVLVRAQRAADAAGVAVRADDIGSTTMTLRFSLPTDAVAPATRASPLARLLRWLRRTA